MEADTGAAVSIISEATYIKTVKKSNPHLRPAEISLRTYTGEKIEILGCHCSVSNRIFKLKYEFEYNFNPFI